MNFTENDSRLIYQGRAFSVRQAKVSLPDGRQQRLDIVEHAPAVTLVPVDEQGQIWFIRQYRHPAGETLLELPAGVMEAGEEPVVSAQRELREETGQAADQLEQIGAFFLAPGYSTEYMYVFLAQKMHSAPLPGDADEIIEPVHIPVNQAYAMAASGELRDAKSLAALFYARPRLTAWFD